MTTGIYIISGFLGAGKTTLIKKFLIEAFVGENIVLIENDFGEISVDAALLKTGGIEVKEINSGCICCSLSGDFVKALKEVVERFHPDKIIIEPSGVGKLSDIIKACESPKIGSTVKVIAKITVADAKRCSMYLDNFGEFFEDQIENADAVVLSRTETAQDKLSGACAIISELNPKAVIFDVPWDKIKATDILNSVQAIHAPAPCHCHKHDHCAHDHSAEDIFNTITIYTSRIFSASELRDCLRRAEHSSESLLRVKGIVRGTKGTLDLQYIPGDLKITDCSAEGNMICFIGSGLNKQELKAIFDGK